MKRRTFLTRAGGAAAAVGAGAFSILKYPRGAHAAGWGAWPEDKVDALLPPEMRARSVLELHINGGMSAFDSFYTIPSWGQNTGEFLWVYSDQYSNTTGLNAASILEQRFASCTPAEVAGQGLYTSLGAQDGAGNEVFLGPWAWPFRNRPDILSRMRVVVQQHDQAAHEGANPVSFTGSRLGQPRMAGVGTAIQRYFAENPDAPGGGGVRAAPYSYVLYPAGYKPFNAVAASQVGFHPGSSRPMVVSVDPGSELFNLLQRSGIDDQEEFDRAIGFYRAQYEARLRAYGHATPARSTERANYEFADFARRNAPELTDILSSDLFAAIPGTNPNACGDFFAGNDMPRMQARMAASLLRRPSDAARYVMWIDAGLQPAVTGGHDTHGRSVELNGLNVPHTLQALLEIIRDPNNPQPDDDQRIDLDETMIVINTEFGRTPYRQNDTGTNHWPWGYVNIFIGGPAGGQAVYGHMRESDGYAVDYVRPAENRMMILQAMGIYPFSSQSYAVADVPGAEDELEAAARVRDVYLGAEV